MSSQPTPVEESKLDSLKKLNTWKQMKAAGKLTKAEIKADFMKRLRTNVIAMIGQEGRIRQILFIRKLEQKYTYENFKKENFKNNKLLCQKKDTHRL